MMIFSGNTIIEYGTTAMGQFFESRKVSKNMGVFRTTTNPERFLRWMIQPEVDLEVEKIRRERFIKTAQPWWLMETEFSHRGSFNKELYLQIIEKKRANGTLYR